MAQAEAEAKEQCRAAQAEAEGHLAVLEAKQQQDDVLKAEIARLTAEVERLQDETDINKSYADATRSDIAKAEEEAVQLSEAVKAKEAEIETLRTQLLEGGAPSKWSNSAVSLSVSGRRMRAWHVQGPVRVGRRARTLHIAGGPPGIGRSIVSNQGLDPGSLGRRAGDSTTSNTCSLSTIGGQPIAVRTPVNGNGHIRTGEGVGGTHPLQAVTRGCCTTCYRPWGHASPGPLGRAPSIPIRIPLPLATWGKLAQRSFDCFGLVPETFPDTWDVCLRPAEMRSPDPATAPFLKVATLTAAVLKTRRRAMQEGGPRSCKSTAKCAAVSLEVCYLWMLSFRGTFKRQDAH